MNMLVYMASFSMKLWGSVVAVDPVEQTHEALEHRSRHQTKQVELFVRVGFLAGALQRDVTVDALAELGKGLALGHVELDR